MIEGSLRCSSLYAEKLFSGRGKAQSPWPCSPYVSVLFLLPRVSLDCIRVVITSGVDIGTPVVRGRFADDFRPVPNPDCSGLTDYGKKSINTGTTYTGISYADNTDFTVTGTGDNIEYNQPKAYSLLPAIADRLAGS